MLHEDCMKICCILGCIDFCQLIGFKAYFLSKNEAACFWLFKLKFYPKDHVIITHVIDNR